VQGSNHSESDPSMGREDAVRFMDLRAMSNISVLKR